jgi:N-acetylglutamate synthase-like GNAT family acetyltransferase
VRIRDPGPEDHDALAVFLSSRGVRRVARAGELVDPLEHRALIAEDAGRLAGVAGYVPGGERWELLTLHVRERHAGVGTALVEELRRRARDAGAPRLFVVTTNDNLDALRFYQRRGFRLHALRTGAVDHVREDARVEIRLAGEHGIPVHDELELELEP